MLICICSMQICSRGSFCSRIPTKHVELVRVFVEILSPIDKRLIFPKRFKLFTVRQNQINGENVL